MLNMFRTLMHPSSGACDFSIESPCWSCVLVSMCVGVSVWLGWGGIHVAGCYVHTAPTQPHRNSNTHWNKNAWPMWWFNRKVAGSWWWMYWCPKHVEHRRSEIKHNNQWHQVSLLFFNYHKDAQSNIHKILKICVCDLQKQYMIPKNVGKNSAHTQLPSQQAYGITISLYLEQWWMFYTLLPRIQEEEEDLQLTIFGNHILVLLETLIVLNIS